MWHYAAATDGRGLLMDRPLHPIPTQVVGRPRPEATEALKQHHDGNVHLDRVRVRVRVRAGVGVSVRVGVRAWARVRVRP